MYNIHISVKNAELKIVSRKRDLKDKKFNLPEVDYNCYQAFVQTVEVEKTIEIEEFANNLSKIFSE